MSCLFILGMFALVPADLPSHERNPVFRASIDKGLAVGDVRVKLPEPTFRDGQSAEEQKAALAEVAGSSRGAREMLQPSLSAPHRLRLRDMKAEGATLRTCDLFFVLHGMDLDAVKPGESFREFRGEPVEVANMRYEARVIEADDLRGFSPQVIPDHGWLVHVKSRLLDRIAVETTDRIIASRSTDSLVFAAGTVPTFGPEDRFPNHWSTITSKATGDVFGPKERYEGGIGYLKMTRLKGLKEVVAVEVHFVFSEPKAWFNGEPILRSKFGLIAQDQVRRLRRELVKAKK